MMSTTKESFLPEEVTKQLEEFEVRTVLGSSTGVVDAHTEPIFLSRYSHE